VALHVVELTFARGFESLTLRQTFAACLQFTIRPFSDLVVPALREFLELGAFDRSTKFLDRRYGQSFGKKGL
jgi:hypothetical protein